jgi:hypothetical protein
MRNGWIDDHVGDEVRPRAGFEDELAGTLQRTWRGEAIAPPAMPVVPVPTQQPQWRKVAIWTVAAAAVLIGVGIVVSRDDTPHITADTTIPSTPTTVPATTPTTDDVTTTALSTVPPTVPLTTVPTSLPVAVAGSPEEQTVLDYLVALAGGRYLDAAQVLGDGGLELEARSDLRPLFGAQYGLVPGAADREALAAALQRWCAAPAMCVPPTALATDGNRVVATFTIDGVQRSSTFIGATFEGQPLVYGLPLQLPASIAIAETIECPTTDVVDTAWADLDGNGWFELLTMQQNGSPGDPFRVTACGTMLEMEPYEQLSDYVPLTMHTFDPAGGGDLVVIGFNTDTGFQGVIHDLVNGALVAVTDTVYQSGVDRTSFGCVDGSVVTYTYDYVGGTDLSNSSALTYATTVVIGPALPPPTRTLPLPEETDAAFHVIAGYCGELPILG